MARYFCAGDKIPMQDGDFAEIIERLGEGGQGTVYRVRLAGGEFALKWYHKGALQNPNKFYKNLENNVAVGAPSDSFLWPLYITKRHNDSFGYIMNLRPQGFFEFSEFLLARVHFSSLSAAIGAALNVTNGFRELHRRGFSYQDLNDGNFFINPETGDVLICDNDNVAPYGYNLGITGKARYMAPEVVRGKKRPDIMSDRFSLSVVLFRLLFLDHPLEGRRVLECPCLTEELELRFYGKDPIFVFDTDDDRNRPVNGIHRNVLKFWQLYPKLVRDKFAEAFSKDTMHGNKPRATDNDWQLLFTQLKGQIATCVCGGETFLSTDGESTCLCCELEIPRPPVLNCHNKYKVALFPSVKLYRCHTDCDSDDFRQVHGEVIRNRTQTQIWGLRNLSESVWTVEYKDGTVRQLAAGEVCVITKIKKIYFPNCVGVTE